MPGSVSTDTSLQTSLGQKSGFAFGAVNIGSGTASGGGSVPISGDGAAGSVPTWVWITGGALIIGGILFALILRKK